MSAIDSPSPGIAPLGNVGMCYHTLKRAMNRPPHLPGIVVFYGPSGYGKSTAATWAAIRTDAVYVQARSSWTRKAAHQAILKGLGVTPARTVAEMSDQIAEELALSKRPLIVDEVDYDSLTLAQLRARLSSLRVADLEALLAYEEAGQARAPFVTLLANRITRATAK